MSEPAESQPRVEFTTTVDDYMAWYEFALQHDSGLRSQWLQGFRTARTTLLWLTAALIAAAFLEYRWWQDSGQVSAAGVIALVALVVFACAAGQGLTGKREKSYLAAVRRMVESGGSWFVRSPQTIVVGEKGIINTSVNGYWEYTWSHGVESLAIRPDYIYIYCVGGAYMIPKRAFGDTKSLNEFVECLRAAMAASGGPAFARDLREWLKDRDAACPECRYNLRGLTHPRCPECGLQITHELLRVKPLVSPKRMNEGVTFV